ncbi:hypothetical protein MTR67_050501 [Solanum verrucosum]|uniref:Uncharacterized protein n=1 Tax=Solanum verrucosum TaxID=315347 RepID=A0AAF0V5I2_SOLVR|nr:hypothetical protein MTR67_050501 [Solanum verrucosum]
MLHLVGYDILDRTNIADAKPVRTPIACASCPGSKDGSPLEDPTQYRNVVGSLQYLMFTRPNVAFIVNKLSQFASCSTATHSTMAKTFSWSSKKLQVVARSSTEAEYRAIASTTVELCWVCNLLKELSVTPAKTPVIYCDNLSATYVCANPVFHSRMKHIEFDYHFVRKLVQQCILWVSHVSSKDQLVDMLTKSLPSGSFELLCSKIGFSDRPTILRGHIRDIS